MEIRYFFIRALSSLGVRKMKRQFTNLLFESISFQLSLSVYTLNHRLINIISRLTKKFQVKENIEVCEFELYLAHDLSRRCFNSNSGFISTASHLSSLALVRGIHTISSLESRDKLQRTQRNKPTFCRFRLLSVFS